jgi:resuscitation-promoting factor RpfA
MLHSCKGKHRRPSKAGRIVALVGVTGAAVAAPLLATGTASAATASEWDAVAQCESGGNWSINTGNGYYGGLQFSASSWRNVGGTGLPHEHSRETQILMGQRLQARAGWGSWPSCSSKLGLR